MVLKAALELLYKQYWRHTIQLKAILMKKVLLVVILLYYSFTVFAQSSATWIWYPGDYEIWLHREISLRRIQRTNIFPPFYRLDTHYGNIKFSKQVNLAEPEEVFIKATGTFSVQQNWEFIPNKNGWFTLPKGNYRLSVNVINYDSLPSVFIRGKSVNSDSSWQVTCYNDKDLPVDYSYFNDSNHSPLHFPFSYEEISPVSANKAEQGYFIDFGKETFGYLILRQIKGEGLLNVYYGESKEEAFSVAYAEIHDTVTIPKDSTASYTFKKSRGLRYAYVVPSANIQIGSYALLYEYLPVEKRGSFRSSNERLNKIWDVAAYTLQLTTREFMLDGIKRDRWVWAGDARQSFLMNYYSFFDRDVNRRTLIALRGKDPVEIHFNHIPDYSLYWLISVYEHYLYTGDKALLVQLYPKMVTLMDFCISRNYQDQFFKSAGSDNMFLDWAEIDKSGELSAYQLLFARSMEALSECAKVMDDNKTSERYRVMAADLKQRTLKLFWNDSVHALVHNIQNNRQVKNVTRYSNMFGVLFHYLDNDQNEAVKKYVLMNDSVQKITTPYMRFYELAALCELGEQQYVTKEILNYWGGMLDVGATTFWEVYNPSEKGTQHYAMYGHPFERSLCHAWGASPVFLLGKYYLGVQPTAPGYTTYTVEPHLGGLQWIDGTVPTTNGDISVYMNKNTIKVKTAQPNGVLKFKSKSKPKSNAGVITSLGNQQYQIELNTNGENVIQYRSHE